jgi:hypothetical protein
MEGRTRGPLVEVRAAELAEHYARILGRQADLRVSAVVRTCLRRLPARLPIRGGDRRAVEALIERVLRLGDVGSPNLVGSTSQIDADIARLLGEAAGDPRGVYRALRAMLAPGAGAVSGRRSSPWAAPVGQRAGDEAGLDDRPARLDLEAEVVPGAVTGGRLLGSWSCACSARGHALVPAARVKSPSPHDVDERRNLPLTTLGLITIDAVRVVDGRAMLRWIRRRGGRRRQRGGRVGRRRIDPRCRHGSWRQCRRVLLWRLPRWGLVGELGRSALTRGRGVRRGSGPIVRAGRRSR